MTDENKAAQQFDPEMMEAMRQQVLEQAMTELESKDERERQKRIAEREKNQQARNKYVAEMKASPEPWVEVIGMEPTEQGIRTELDWNDAFILYLKEQGITGADEDQMMQQYVTMLLRDMVEEMSQADDDSDYL